jgi:WD40 repeat protein
MVHGNDGSVTAAAAASAICPITGTRTGPAPTLPQREAGPRDRRSAAFDVRDPDRYEVLGEHGRGGLGRVSRVHDRDLGRDIAIKELISRGHVGEVRFLREALITARLEHPGIVPVYEAGRWPDGTPFYAMKLVSGRSLRDLIAERATVDQRIGLLHHVIAVADAIAYAHGRHIIHRDLKPANVIVGEFGETIVIDWGLAKELGSADEPVAAGGPYRTSRIDDLTAAGSVLGTPAYMAPEQQRGERVDQRADVFAIGAMLWQLCALEKLPPADRRERDRILRRGGIDRDLVTILDKALDPDPARRYPDAGALAADLKAFKVGARIAARSYSLPAMLAHWTRRHRALALSVAVAATLATAGAITHVRRIAAERDRVATANSTLILQQAELLLQTDPTAAFELLDSYDGTETTRKAMLTAQARGLGLARVHVAPHTQRINTARRLADGSLVTVSDDGTVARTSPAGTIRILARGVAWQDIFDYSSAGRWLGYACEATTICLLDLETEQQRPPPPGMAAFAPVGLAFAPGGDRLAAISAAGKTAIWQLSDGAPPSLRLEADLGRGESLAFVDASTLVTQARDGVHLFHLDASGRPRAAPLAFPIADARDLTASAELHLVAVATTAGHLLIIDTNSDQILEDAALCKSQLNKVAVIAATRAIAYSCQDGDLGVHDLDRRSSTVVTHIEGGATRVAGSPDGRYLLAGGNDGKLVIYDATTRMTLAYLGHATRLSAIVPPSPDFPDIATGDTTGALRVWPLPGGAVEVAITTPWQLYRAILVGNRDPVIAVGNGSTIPWATLAGTSGALTGHNAVHCIVASSSTRPWFVTYGFDDELELWSFGAQPALRTVKTGHGTTSVVVYSPGGERFMVGSQDGAIEEWSHTAGPPRRVGSIHEPVLYLRSLPATDAVAIGGLSGALWLSGPTGLRYLGKGPGAINSVAASPDSEWVVTADAGGVVRMYDTTTRHVVAFQSPLPSSQYLLFSPDGTTLGIATNRTVSLMSPPSPPGAAEPPTAPDLPAWTWDRVGLAVHHFTFSRDSRWFAGVCDHGGIWFNHRGDARWIYVSTGTTRISFGYFSADGTRFVATDASGRALIVDLRANGFQ